MFCRLKTYIFLKRIHKERILGFRIDITEFEFQQRHKLHKFPYMSTTSMKPICGVSNSNIHINRHGFLVV
jgi:hypothetical protein